MDNSNTTNNISTFSTNSTHIDCVELSSSNSKVWNKSASILNSVKNKMSELKEYICTKSSALKEKAYDFLNIGSNRVTVSKEIKNKINNYAVKLNAHRHIHNDTLQAHKNLGLMRNLKDRIRNSHYRACEYENKVKQETSKIPLLHHLRCSRAARDVRDEKEAFESLEKYIKEQELLVKKLDNEDNKDDHKIALAEMEDQVKKENKELQNKIDSYTTQTNHYYNKIDSIKEEINNCKKQKNSEEYCTLANNLKSIISETNNYERSIKHCSASIEKNNDALEDGKDPCPTISFHDFLRFMAVISA